MNKLQKIFNKVATHLLKQNAKSISIMFVGEQCMYRGRNGLKCAAGCLVPDDEYDPEQENMGWRMTKWCAKYTEEENDLILILQIIHDNLSVEEWKEALTKLATSRGMELPVELQ